MTERSPGGRILVVDDLEANRALLRDFLEPEGHEVDEAADGLAALERVALAPPDVVLLDLEMPRMNGFETCRKLKASPETESIPVLMITALTEREQRLAGIDAGADDFIAKPVDRSYLLLRVRNALRTRRLYAKLDAQYRELESLQTLRDDLVQMMVHDMRSPLTALSLTLQLVSEDFDADSAVRRDILEAIALASRVADMVGDVLDVGRLETNQMPLERRELDLRQVCESVVGLVTGSTPARGRVATRLASGPTMVSGDERVLERIVANLIDNALKYDPGHEPVEVVVDAGESGVRLSVVDRGPGVPDEARERIFEKYGQAHAPREYRRSTGLGLSFCRLAVEAHGGRIGVEPVEGGGSRFWIELPAVSAAG